MANSNSSIQLSEIGTCDGCGKLGSEGEEMGTASTKTGLEKRVVVNTLLLNKRKKKSGYDLRINFIKRSVFISIMLIMLISFFPSL